MSSRRYESLDLWRGIACLAVTVYHVAWFRVPLTGFGWMGVPLFFVISGYCIAAAADNHVDKGRSLREFAWRRWKRIFPPYFAAVGLSVVEVKLFQLWTPISTAFADGPGQMTLPQWLGSLTLTEGWRTFVWRGPAHWWLETAWTLGYEEQFYVVVGLLAAAFGRRWLPVSALVTIVTLSALSKASSLYGLFLDGHWLVFACGIAVYAYRQRSSRVILAMLVGGLVVSASTADWSSQGVGPSLCVGAGFALLLIATAPFDAVLSSHSALRPLKWCGVRCYSIYLVHWPLVKGVDETVSFFLGNGALVTLLVTLPVAMAATLVMAAPFHAYIERPCLNTTPGQLRPIPNEAIAAVPGAA